MCTVVNHWINYIPLKIKRVKILSVSTQPMRTPACFNLRYALCTKPLTYVSRGNLIVKSVCVIRVTAICKYIYKYIKVKV